MSYIYKNVEQQTYGNIPNAFFDIENAKFADNKNGGNSTPKKVEVFKYDPTNKSQVVALEDGDAYLVNVVDVHSNVAIITGTYNNKFNQILGIVNETMKNGPYTMNGRPDGSVEIRNQKIYEPLYKTYIWNGGTGEILNFKVSSDFSKEKVPVVTSGNMGPDKKPQSIVINTQGRKVTGESLGTFFEINGGGEEYNGPTSLDRDPNRLPIDTPYESLDSRYKNRKFIEFSHQEDKYDTLPKYSSIKDAISDLSNSDVSADEWLDYFNQLMSRLGIITSDFNSSNTQQDLHTLIREGNNIPPYIIRRKVVIKGWLTCSDYCTNDNIKNVATRIKNGYEYLKSQFGSNIIKEEKTTTMSFDGQDLAVGELGYGITQVSRVYVDGIVIVEVPIQGWRVLKSPQIQNLETSSKSDMIQSIYDSVKASATIIGDPNLCEGLNVNIRGVGPLSGKYYITSVTHSINSSGYSCDVTFQENDIQISQSVIKVEADLKKAYIDFQKWVEKEYPTFDFGIIKDGIPSYYKITTENAVEALDEGQSAFYQVKDGVIYSTYTDESYSSIPTIQSTQDFNTQL